MLVAIEADAVAEAMGEESVAGAEAGGSNDCASGIVDGAGNVTGASSVESGVLGFTDGFVGLLNFICRLAENASASDVGFVALDFAAAVDQDYIAFLELLRLAGAVG
jgi:hypothetical protein